MGRSNGEEKEGEEREKESYENIHCVMSGWSAVYSQ